MSPARAEPPDRPCESGRAGLAATASLAVAALAAGARRRRQGGKGVGNAP